MRIVIEMELEVKIPKVFGEVPIPKSTAHRMVAEVDIPTSNSQQGTILGADGTGCPESWRSTFRYEDDPRFPWNEA